MITRTGHYAGWRGGGGESLRGVDFFNVQLSKASRCTSLSVLHHRSRIPLEYETIVKTTRKKSRHLWWLLPPPPPPPLSSTHCAENCIVDTLCRMKILLSIVILPLELWLLYGALPCFFYFTDTNLELLFGGADPDSSRLLSKSF